MNKNSFSLIQFFKLIFQKFWIIGTVSEHPPPQKKTKKLTKILKHTLLSIQKLENAFWAQYKYSFDTPTFTKIHLRFTWSATSLTSLSLLAVLTVSLCPLWYDGSGLWCAGSWCRFQSYTLSLAWEFWRWLTLLYLEQCGGVSMLTNCLCWWEAAGDCYY